MQDSRPKNGLHKAPTRVVGSLIRRLFALLWNKGRPSIAASLRKTSQRGSDWLSEWLWLTFGSCRGLFLFCKIGKSERSQYNTGIWALIQGR